MPTVLSEQLAPANHSSRARKWLLLFAAAAIGVGVVYWKERQGDEFSLRSIKARVGHSIVVGDSKAKVLDWLQTQQCTTLRSVNPNNEIVGHESIVQLSGFPPNAVDHAIRAEFPAVRSEFSLFPTVVILYCFLNSDGTLIGTYAREWQIAL